MKLKELLELVDGKLLSSPKHLDYDVSCGAASDLISDILMCVKDSAVLFTGLIIRLFEWRKWLICKRLCLCEGRSRRRKFCSFGA